MSRTVTGVFIAFIWDWKSFNKLPIYIPQLHKKYMNYKLEIKYQVLKKKIVIEWNQNQV